jgi:hypothetical protein
VAEPVSGLQVEQAERVVQAAEQVVFQLQVAESLLALQAEATSAVEQAVLVVQAAELAVLQ